MVRFRWLLVLAILVVGRVSASGEDAVHLRWQLTPGKTFYQEMLTDQNVVLTAQGKETTNKTRQTIYLSWTPEKALDDKGWIVRQKVLGLKMEMEFLGQKLEYDSSNPGAAPKQLADAMAPLIGAEFRLTIGPNWKVTQLEGYKELLDKLGQVNPRLKQMLAATMTEDALKYVSDQTFALLPGKAVKKGDSWEMASKVPLGAVGSLEVRRTYTYEGKADKLERIKVESRFLGYEPPAANAPAGLPFKVKKGDLQGSTATGVILFDNEKGRVASAEQTTNLSGKMVFEINGADEEVELKQTQKITTKTTDTNPVQK